MGRRTQRSNTYVVDLSEAAGIRTGDCLHESGPESERLAGRSAGRHILFESNRSGHDEIWVSDVNRANA